MSIFPIKTHLNLPQILRFLEKKNKREVKSLEHVTKDEEVIANVTRGIK